MSVIILPATTSKTDVCPADTAETADFAGKVVLKTPFQELRMKTASLNTFPTPKSVSAAVFVQAYAPAVSGKWKIINKH